MQDLTILSGLMEQFQAQDNASPEAVDEISLRVSSYEPLSFQCNVRLRDRTLAWGTFVSEDPLEALTKALYIASRGEEARTSESTAVFHPTRQAAQEYLDDLLEVYTQQIAATKTEFEPYKGWVCVVFPRPPHNLDALKPNVEIRQVVEWSQGETKPAPAPRNASPSTRTPSPAKAPGEAPVGRAAKQKPELEQEYKLLTGKAPDRNIKKADLAKILDDMEAARGAPATEEGPGVMEPAVVAAEPEATEDDNPDDWM